MYILLVLPLIVFLVALGLLCLCLKRKWCCLASWGVALVLNICTESVPLHVWHGGEDAGEGMSLKVFSYNVNCVGPYISQRKDSLRGFLSMIDSVDADVVCLSELYSNQKAVIDSMDKRYPYAMNRIVKRWYDVESIVYSKYPITEAYQFHWDCSDSHGGYMEVFRLNLDIQGKPLALFQCHLASNNYGGARKAHADTVAWLKGLGEYIALTREGYENRAVQARILRDSIEHYPGPTLVCGDFNDLSGSYALRTIQGETLSDAWWNAGCGFGFTFDSYHLLLRLDHILYSEEFRIRECRVLNEYRFSDHYPVVAEFTCF